VQLRASGVPRTACDSPAFRLGLETGIEAAVGAGSQSKGQHHDDRNHQRPPDASHLCGDQERQKEILAAIGALWAHTDGKGFNQKLDYLPLNGAEIVVREIGDELLA
jgi:hypothetical protein